MSRDQLIANIICLAILACLVMWDDEPAQDYALNVSEINYD